MKRMFGLFGGRKPASSDETNSGTPGSIEERRIAKENKDQASRGKS